MSFIASTRLKKLKKLFLIGKAIIANWGWGYFFYIAKLEFKKQKFSVFKADSKPVPLFYRDSFQKAYEKYLNFNEENFSKNDLNSINLPQITFLLSYESVDVEYVQKTIKSFLDQSFDNWNLILIPKNKESITNLRIPSDKRFSTIPNGENNSILDKIHQLDSDFVGLIDAGVLLHSYSLIEFSKFLKNNPNSDLFYSDHDIINKNKMRSDPFFKPDWSFFTFNSFDYVSSFCIISRFIVEKILKNKIIHDSFSFDLLLHCIYNSKKIDHICLPLYSIIDHSQNLDNKHKKNLLEKHLKQNNIHAKIENGLLPNTFRVNYELKSQPKVSILIPTKNNRLILKRCLESIEKNTNYKNIEIIIIDNPALPSEIYFDPKLQEYYDKVPYKVITYNGNFNFSKMNNIAVKESTGDLLLFLNDDTKILDKFWLDEMVSILLQNDVGAVGPKLVFGDETLQHAGMVFLKTGSGFHPFMKLDDDAKGYQNFANIIKECSAVTGACLLTKKNIFEEVGQFDEDFDVYYGDSDLCLKIKNVGYKIIYTPFTKLLHEGSFTLRGSGASYFAVEAHQRFLEKWPELKRGDPFYHPVLDWDYSISQDMTEDKS